MSEIARVEVCETFVAASAARRVGIEGRPAGPDLRDRAPRMDTLLA